jgi:hypothetical protein
VIEVESLPFATSDAGRAVSATLPNGAPGIVTTRASAVPSDAPDPFASITRMCPAPPDVTSVKTNRAESTPAGTVISKIALPPTAENRPPGRSVQSVSVSVEASGVRFPNAS